MLVFLAVLHAATIFRRIISGKPDIIRYISFGFLPYRVSLLVYYVVPLIFPWVLLLGLYPILKRFF